MSGTENQTTGREVIPLFAPNFIRRVRLISDALGLLVSVPATVEHKSRLLNLLDDVIAELLAVRENLRGN